MVNYRSTISVHTEKEEDLTMSKSSRIAIALSLFAVALSVASFAIDENLIPLPHKSHIALFDVSADRHLKIPVPAEALIVSDQWGYIAVIFHDYHGTSTLNKIMIFGDDASDEPYGRKSFVADEVGSEVWKLWSERFSFNRNKVSLAEPHATVIRF